ncbi:hypothetical protein HN51_007258 [Arachis hypogaea]|uniref:Peptidase metallopeptidase domain-containing protein n=1 Tax=Arachis hypogaea TaxID=3818 RepID=A0A445D8S8_ARAHY|nr:metalloendoproteinase 5-MMP [Arachis hypogaea]QHO41348.1 Metalloendoproteinase 2-MMP [Arachis hypogaea]RYR59577.1 hypothetical protein Ahy_A05g025475 [Arachis hypogaea]
MKRHLLTLLFSFLLLDPSLSLMQLSGAEMFGVDVEGFVKQLKQIFPDVARDTGLNFFTTMLGYIKQPGATPKSNIPGLHYVKQYLNNYGYLQDSYGSSFTDEMDQNTVSAIKQYQNFFGLRDTTGNLNQETLDLISRFRCGVPDGNLIYSLSPTNRVSWPKGKNWYSNRHNHLTYGFYPQFPDDIATVFRDSFKQWWSDAITEELSLTFKETSYVNADIKVGLQNFNDKMVVGISLIELSVSNNAVGYMLLDANNKNWALPNVGSLGSGGIDLGAVAMHQIGHLIGLSHSGDSESVMYPYILPGNQRKVQLSNDDIQQIKQLSSANGNGNGVGSSPWGLITTFLLGFPCLFLLY